MKNNSIVKSYSSDELPERGSTQELSNNSDIMNDETVPRLKAVAETADQQKVIPVTADQQKVIPVTPPVEDWALPNTPFVEDDEGEVAVPRKPLSLETLLLPAFHLRYIAFKSVGSGIQEQNRSHTQVTGALKSAKLYARLPFLKDSWLVTTFITACVVGILALWYFFAQNQTLLYKDANAHLLIARRLFDNTTPGLAQLGGIWLPLPHILMVPLVWNDFLWRTGLAGSLVSLCCYILASVYVFLSARRLTKNNVASFVGTLVFILNPNILYLQSTPLSELVLIATFTAACYYFIVWAQTDALKYLILTACATFLTTLSRYDGWALFVALLVLIAIIGWVRHHKRVRIEANLIIFGSMGGLGIVLWFLWNFVIFGDPLYFQRGPFSAQAQQRDLINSHLLYTYHDVYQSIRYYLIDCIDTVGPILFVIGVVAVLVFLWRRRLAPEMFAALSFLVPIPFYILSLYTGQASLYLPTAVPGYATYTLFNARYGEVVVMPAAVFLAFLVDTLMLTPRRVPHKQVLTNRFKRVMSQYVGPLVCTGIILGQSAMIVNGGIITLQDGEYGLACSPTHSIVIFLAQHYTGGRILEDLYTAKIDTLEPTVGIDFKNMVYEGSGKLWTEALSQPQKIVDWIIVNPNDKSDYIARKIDLTSPKFTSQFSFILQEPGGLELFHRKGLAQLPWHSVPRSVFTAHLLCGRYNPGQYSQVPVVPSRVGERQFVLQGEERVGLQ